MTENKLITKKLHKSVYIIIIIIASAVCLSLYTSVKVRGIFIENSKKLLSDNTFLLKQTVEQFYAQTIDNVSANFHLFRSNIYSNGSFSVKHDDTVKLTVTDQKTNDVSEIDLPLMYYNNETVLNNFSLVDNIVRLVQIEGLATTVFQVIDDGLLRLTTNVMTKENKRAVGTYIPGKSQVYKTVMNGEVYTGRAYVVNQWYWTVYEPIIVDGEVIGVLYMGIKESELLKVLKKTFDSVRVSKNGYAFILDGEANLIIHPFNEGQNVYNFVSDDNVRVFEGLTKGDEGWLEYMYPKPDGSKGTHLKITRYMMVDELGWSIGVGAYLDEFYEEFVHYEIIYGIFFILLLTIAGSFIAINFFNTNRKLIKSSRELKKLAVDAEDANVAKSVFLANMSHEIRTPLNSIIGFSELLSSASLPLKEKEYAGTITKSAKSLLDIINDILDISKIESGTVNLTEELFSLRSLMDSVVKMFSMKAENKNIRFVFLYSTDIPAQVYGDSVRIQQLLVNLIGNAIKFTPEGGEVVFSVLTAFSREETVGITFEVKDSGIGIAKDSLRDIFNPFSQADYGINRQYGGTGLGLAICEKLTSMMGSEIEVESEVGKGSTFRFALELKRDFGEHVDDDQPDSFRELKFAVCKKNAFGDVAREMVIDYLKRLGRTVSYPVPKDIVPDMIFCFDPKELSKIYNRRNEKYPDAKIVFMGDVSALKNPEQTDYSLDHPVYSSKIYNTVVHACKMDDLVEINTIPENIFKGLVLVAEDNLTNQILMKVILEQLGLNVDFVETGQEVLDYCRKNTPDLILMDINMPLMDGLTAYRILKEQRLSVNKPYIPVVALTANAVKGDKDVYLSAGMDDYLSKPLDKKELIRILHRFINNRSYIPSTNINQKLRLNTDSEKYDKKKSVEMIGINESDYDVILSNLFMTVESDLKILEDAVKKKDAEKILSVIHYMKGAAVNLHLYPVAKLLEKYALKAKRGDTEGYDTDRIREKYKQIEKEIYTK